NRPGLPRTQLKQLGVRLASLEWPRIRVLLPLNTCGVRRPRQRRNGSWHQRRARRWLRVDCRQKPCNRARLDERRPQAVANKIVDMALLPETHLGFCWVYVDVHFFGGHFEEEEDDWEAGWGDHVAVGLRDGMYQKPVADEALVYENVDGVAVELLQLRL